MGFFDISPEAITNEPVSKALVFLSLPLLAQNLVQVIQQVIDIFWVGHINQNAVAAVGLSTPVMSLSLTVSFAGVYVGTQVLVSQRVGADDGLGARTATSTAMFTTVVIGLIVGALLYLNVGILLTMMMSAKPQGAQSNLLSLASRYLGVLSLGVVFAGLSDTLEASYMGWGESRITLFINLFTVGINLCLDPILIFGIGPVPKLGLRGAALATVGSYIGGFLLGAWFVSSNTTSDIITVDTFRLDLKDLYKLLKIGLPRSVQSGASTVSGIIMVIVVFTIGGGLGLSAYTVVSRFGALAVRIIISFNMAAQTIVGQSLGAKNIARARRITRVGAGTLFVLLTVLAGIQVIIAETLSTLLVPSMSDEALSVSVFGLQILALSYPAHGVMSIFEASLDAARKTKTTMVFSLVRTWGIQLPIAILVGIVYEFGLAAVFWAQTLSIIVVTGIIILYYEYAIQQGLYSRAIDQIGAI